MDHEISEVYAARDTQEVHLIQAVLKDAGIEARVVGDQLQSALGELSTMASTPRIWVHSADVERARDMIADWQASVQSEEPPQGEWRCANCGEQNEAAFDICWSCQTARAGEM